MTVIDPCDGGPEFAIFCINDVNVDKAADYGFRMEIDNRCNGDIDIRISDCVRKVLEAEHGE